MSKGYRPSPIVCCKGCGRDTRAADGLCSRCVGGQRFLDHSNSVGRKELNTNLRAASVLAPTEGERDEVRAADRYHGESIRDDL